MVRVLGASWEKQSPAWESYYRGIPSFNLIPIELRPAELSVRHLLFRLVLFVAIAAVGWLTLGLYQERLPHKDAIEALQTDMETLAAQLEALDADRGKAEELLSAAELLKQEHEAVLIERQQAWQELGMNEADWPRAMTVVFHYRFLGVELLSISQRQLEVVITGRALDYVSLLRYHNALLFDPAITRIVSLNSQIEEAFVSFSMVVRIAPEEE